MRLLRSLPIRARLTMWQVGVFSLIFGALGVFLVLNQRDTLQTDAQESIEHTSRVIVDRLIDQDSDLHTILQPATIPGESGPAEVIGQIVDASGAVVDQYGTSYAPLVDHAVLTAAARDGHWHGRLALPGRTTDDMVIAVQIESGAHAGEFLVLAQTLSAMESTAQRFVDRLLIAAGVALVLAVLGGWFVARAALRPVDEMSRRAAEVDAAAPRERLPVPPAKDELSRLATTLNGMLDRLGNALEAERRFSADASHELRTPLGIMEAELDVALRSRRTPLEARAVLQSVKEEATVLGRIVANLLVLSRAEATGEVDLNPQETDLLDLAYGVASRLRPLAEGRGVDLSVEGDPVDARVDADLFAQAVSNLVDNALSHTESGGSVVVRVSDGQTPRLTVTDTGCGIPPEELPRIFDRFYRVDRARRRAHGGAGLGLEITRRIVEAHHGQLAVTSALGVGTTFTISLPGAGSLSDAR